MIKQFKIALGVLCLTASVSNKISAQQVVNDSTNLFDLDLEQIMNIHIVSASKKSESLFDAPVSASVLTKEEIKRAGCTSIMEALKLVPGIIVREQTNGNYDIHVRGLDGVPPNNVFTNLANNTTLVMIDNRPVYNYYSGGTFWEALPVDLNDIERIEVVRGPASAMYGPNAATGVINIITRTPAHKGLYSTVNAQYGTHNTKIANASVGYKLNNSLNFITSANFQQRDRHDGQDKYYDVTSNSYIPLESFQVRQGPFSFPISQIESKFPNREQAMDKYGVNAFINFTPADKVRFNLSAGLENSEVQKVFGVNQITPLSTSNSDTRYIDFKGSAKGFSTQISYLAGTQTTALGFNNQKFDLSSVDALLEYDFVYKNLSVKPGINFRKAVYDDSRFVDETIGEGVFNGSRSIETQAASLRAEYKAFDERLRLIAGFRLDKFNHPSKGWLSHQFGINFKPSENHLFRITQSRAYRAPFMVDTYISMKVGGGIPIGPNKILEPTIKGNPELKLVTVDMLEVGYRGKLSENFIIDIEVFDMRAKNFAYVVQQGPQFQMRNADTIIVIPMPIVNIPTTAREIGTTISLNYVSGKLQLKPFVTYQYTLMKDYSDYRNTATALPDPSNNFNPAQFNINKGQDVRHQATPRVFGGAYMNYQISNKFNINISPYYLSGHKILYSDNLVYRDGIRGVENIKGKLSMNARLTYKPVKYLDIFVSGKNLLGNDAREFYQTDRIGSTYLAGLNFEF